MDGDHTLGYALMKQLSILLTSELTAFGGRVDDDSRLIAAAAVVVGLFIGTVGVGGSC